MGCGIEPERSDIAGAESFHSLEGIMCGTVMRGAVARGCLSGLASGLGVPAPASRVAAIKFGQELP